MCLFTALGLVSTGVASRVGVEKLCWRFIRFQKNDVLQNVMSFGVKFIILENLSSVSS